MSLQDEAISLLGFLLDSGSRISEIMLAAIRDK